MAKLPDPNEISLGMPQAARGVTAIRATQVTPDLATGAVIQDIGELAYREGQKMDKLRAEDTLNQIRQARLDLTMGEDGAYSVKGGNVLSTGYSSGYKDRMATKVEGLMATLSPQQQAILKPHADREVIGLQSDVLRHSMGEAERYKGIVRQGSLDTAANAGMEQWNDPVAFGKSLTDINTTVMGLAREQGVVGKTDAEKDTLMSMQRKAMSPMYAGAITRALDAKTPEALTRAEELYKQGGLAIDPSARIQLGEHLVKAREALTLQTDTVRYLTDTVGPANTPAGKFSASLASSITSAESRGVHIDQGTGQVIRGPVVAGGANKGEQAVGAHQIMPKSAQQDAKEAGLPWDEKLFYAPTPEGKAYHDKLQQAHVTRLMSMFTNPAEVAAAYNAGEGNVLKAKAEFETYQKTVALAKVDRTITPVLPGGYNAAKDGPITFLDFLPKPGETKPYVARVMSTFKAAPDVVKPTARDIEAAFRQQYPNRPDLVAEATRVVTHQLANIENARKAEIETSKEEAYKYMAQGKMFNELPPSVLTKLTPKDEDEVRKTFDAHIAGTPRDSNQGLLSNINSDPGYLARVPNSAWNGPLRTQLSEYDWKRFDTQRSSQLGGNTKDSGSLDSGTVGSVLASRLRMLDIDPTPKESNKQGMAVVNSMRAVIDQSILERQQQAGRKLTDIETRQHIDSMFSTSEQLKNTLNFLPSFMGGGGTTKTSVLQMGYSDIPSDVRGRIETQLKAKGVAKPTDTQVLTVYKQSKLGLL